MRRTFTLLFSIAVLGIISCSKTHEVMQSNQILLVNDLIGKWEVTSYTDSGIDKTSQLTALSLQFNSSGEFLIFNNDSIINGNWTIVPQIGLDELRITVSSTNQPYLQFAAIWYAYDQTTSSVKISNSSPSRSQVIQLKRI